MATNKPEDLLVDLNQVEDKYFIDLSKADQNEPISKEDDYNFIKTEKARAGRATQVYNKNTLARLVAGCIVLSKIPHDKVLMISSSKHQDLWVFPKGGIEIDEVDNFRLTARRETWEEAGVTGKILHKLPAVEDHRFVKTKDLQKNYADVIDLSDSDGVKIPRSEFHFYEMEVVELSEKWPESGERQRRWCTYEEAKHELLKAARSELLEALNNSRIKKDCGVVKLDQHSDQLLDAQPQTDDY